MNNQYTQFNNIKIVRKDQLYYLYDLDEHRFINRSSMPLSQMNNLARKLAKYNIIINFNRKDQIWFLTKAMAFMAMLMLTGTKYKLPRRITKQNITRHLNIKIGTRKNIGGVREYYVSLLGMENDYYQHPLSGKSIINILNTIDAPSRLRTMFNENNIRYTIKGSIDNHHPEHMLIFNSEQDARNAIETFLNFILNDEHLLKQYKIYRYMLESKTPLETA